MQLRLPIKIVTIITNSVQSGKNSLVIDAFALDIKKGPFIQSSTSGHETLGWFHIEEAQNCHSQNDPDTSVRLSDRNFAHLWMHLELVGKIWVVKTSIIKFDIIIYIGPFPNWFTWPKVISQPSLKWGATLSETFYFKWIQFTAKKKGRGWK